MPEETSQATGAEMEIPGELAMADGETLEESIMEDGEIVEESIMEDSEIPVELIMEDGDDSLLKIEILCFAVFKIQIEIKNKLIRQVIDCISCSCSIYVVSFIDCSFFDSLKGNGRNDKRLPSKIVKEELTNLLYGFSTFELRRIR